MRTIILASNRRVEFTLSNAGQASQESVRQYPFNAAVVPDSGVPQTVVP